VALGDQGSEALTAESVGADGEVGADDEFADDELVAAVAAVPEG
jgi:hypothetical protein